ncbi:MAG: 16S rRNA (adenine(1518)-N(6)/adenine(1519)-N(6))-dimethyltransferase RsmA [bacterium]|nr:16S rRNA (adenine(1518)-N(6)/adenine(1519)-N(6))-dimethyltransferase RsmA [bacterium]MDT8395195.1 16S rRNA (adenine(1518)-N(6)/adenine(1519)-N(6))-dimethyltransferase RsmA [bacterium]
MKGRPYVPPAYGQHFLHDKNILKAIVAAARLSPDDPVIEIGVGTGRLTEMILDEGVKVRGVEVDSRLFDDLVKKFGGNPDFELVRGDILRVSWDDLLPREGKAVLLGNLPYAVSTQIIFRALEFRARVSRAVFLVQWEVGRRMCAPPGGKDYGILSVVCQLFGKPEIVRKVPPGVFLPPPRVDSALVRWEVLEQAVYPVPDRAFTRRVIKAAFGQRRKKLVNSLAAGLAPAGKDTMRDVIKEMGLGASVRAEQLSVEQFAELATRLSDTVTR